MKILDHIFTFIVGAWTVSMFYLLTFNLPTKEPTYHHGYWTPARESTQKEVGKVIVECDTLSVIETTKYFYRFKQ